MQHCKRRTFTTYEDKAIRDSVQIYGENWDAVSKKLPGRTPKQCHDRYINYLRSGLKSEPWTKEEDDIVVKLYHEIGSKWSKMMFNLPGRSGNDIKNRWHKHISKRISDNSQTEYCAKNKYPSLVTNNDDVASSPDEEKVKEIFNEEENEKFENLAKEFELKDIEIKTKTEKIDLCAEIGWSEGELQEILEEISYNNMFDRLYNQSLFM